MSQTPLTHALYIKPRKENAVINIEALRQMAAHSTGEKTWDGRIKLDVGCGKTCRQGYIGLDKDPTLKVDIVHDLENSPIPIDDGVVDEVYTSHTLEHLSGLGYMHAMNEFWRILKTGGKVEIIVPYFRTKVAVQDPTHRMQFDVDSFKYLDRESTAWSYYNNPMLQCNFEIAECELRGKDFEHIMVNVTLIKKDMPEGITITPIGIKRQPLEPTEMCTGFHMPSIEEIARQQEPPKDRAGILDFMNKDLGVSWDEQTAKKFCELVDKFPAIFNVAAECAQLREVHQTVAFNVLGEDGFIQELLNVQRKMVRVYGMALSGSDNVEIWKLRKNMFDLVNYAIAALETLDREIESGKGVAVTRRVPVNGNVNHMVEAALRDSGGYPEGTAITPRLIPV